MEQCEKLRLAGLVHDIGKCAISNRIWYKSSDLSVSERLEMQGHTYQTEYVLSHGEPFASWAHMASSVQERADGTGYHRRTQLSDLACNILAAANEYDEAVHATPAKKAVSPKVVAERMTKHAADKKYLPVAVTAVLQAAGHMVKEIRTAYPFNMTRREIQVMARLAMSETTAQVANALNISPKTADHHIQNIYKKTGVNARPALALLALEHAIVMD